MVREINDLPTTSPHGSDFGPFANSWICISAHLGATDVLKSGLRVGRTTPAGTLELVVSPFGASVEGTVTKAQTPIPGAYVRVEMTNTEEEAAECQHRNANRPIRALRLSRFAARRLHVLRHRRGAVVGRAPDQGWPKRGTAQHGIG
jgi:hypothetical protein